MAWWVIVILVLTAVFAFFEWRSWKKPLARGLMEDQGWSGRGDADTHNIARDFDKPRD